MTVPRLGDRSLFPLLEPRAYLNHAGVSPPSEPVRLAVHEAVDDFARRGGDAVGAAVQRRERLRARIAELLGAAPEASAASGTLQPSNLTPWTSSSRPRTLVRAEE